MADTPSKSRIEELRQKKAAIETRVQKNDKAAETAATAATGLRKPAARSAATATVTPTAGDAKTPVPVNVDAPAAPATRVRTRSRASISSVGEEGVAAGTEDVEVDAAATKDSDAKTTATKTKALGTAKSSSKLVVGAAEPSAKPPIARVAASRATASTLSTTASATTLASSSRLRVATTSNTAVSTPISGRPSVGGRTPSTATTPTSASATDGGFGTDVSPATDAMKEAHEKEIQTLETRYTGMIDKIRSQQLEDLQRFQQMQAQMTAELAEARQVISTFSSQSDSNTSTATETQAEIDALKAAVAKLQQENAELTEKHASNAVADSKKISKADAELMDKEIAALKVQCTQQAEELLLVREQYEKLLQSHNEAGQTAKQTAETLNIIIVERDTLHTQIEGLTAQIHTLQMEQESLNLDKETLELEKEELSATVDELAARVSGMDSMKKLIGELQCELDNVREEKDALTATISSAAQMNTPSKTAPSGERGTADSPLMLSPESGYNVLRDRNSKLRAALAALKEQYDSTSKELEIRSGRCAALQDETHELQMALSTLQHEHERLCESHQAAQETVAELQMQLQEAGVDELTTMVETLTIQNEDSRAKLEEASKQVRDLEEMHILDEQLEAQHADYEAQLNAEISALAAKCAQLESICQSATHQLTLQHGELMKLRQAEKLDATEQHGSQLTIDTPKLVTALLYAKSAIVQQVVSFHLLFDRLPFIDLRFPALAQQSLPPPLPFRVSGARWLLPQSLAKHDACVLLDFCQDLVTLRQLCKSDPISAKGACKLPVFAFTDAEADDPPAVLQTLINITPANSHSEVTKGQGRSVLIRALIVYVAECMATKLMAESARSAAGTTVATYLKEHSDSIMSGLDHLWEAARQPSGAAVTSTFMDSINGVLRVCSAISDASFPDSFASCEPSRKCSMHAFCDISGEVGMMHCCKWLAPPSLSVAYLCKMEGDAAAISTSSSSVLRELLLRLHAGSVQLDAPHGSGAALEFQCSVGLLLCSRGQASIRQTIGKLSDSMGQRLASELHAAHTSGSIEAIHHCEDAYRGALGRCGHLLRRLSDISVWLARIADMFASQLALIPAGRLAVAFSPVESTAAAWLEREKAILGIAVTCEALNVCYEDVSGTSSRIFEDLTGPAPASSSSTEPVWHRVLSDVLDVQSIAESACQRSAELTISCECAALPLGKPYASVSDLLYGQQSAVSKYSYEAAVPNDSMLGASFTELQRQLAKGLTDAKSYEQLRQKAFEYNGKLAAKDREIAEHKHKVAALEQKVVSLQSAQGKLSAKAELTELGHGESSRWAMPPAVHDVIERYRSEKVAIATDKLTSEIRRTLSPSIARPREELALGGDSQSPMLNLRQLVSLRRIPKLSGGSDEWRAQLLQQGALAANAVRHLQTIINQPGVCMNDPTVVK